MWLQARMYLLIALLFCILYGVITGLGTWMGAGSAITYLIIGFGFLLIQYLISPAIVGWSMKIKWVSEKEAPELHQMVAEIAERAGLDCPSPESAYPSSISPTPSLLAVPSGTAGSA